MSDFERIREDLSAGRRELARARTTYQGLRTELDRARREASALARRARDARDAPDGRLRRARAEEERLETEVAKAFEGLRGLRDRLAGLDRDLFPGEGLAPDDLVEGADGDLPFLLLPVRVETRFARNAPELLVRIYPDDVSVDAHEPELTEEELAAGRAYWIEAWASAGESPVHEQAWRKLLRSCEPGRGTWIVSRTRPENLGTEDAEPRFGEVDLRPEPWSRAPLARLLPDRWVVFGRSEGEALGPHVGLPVPEEMPVGPSPDENAAPLEQLGAFDEEAAWLVDFEAAVAVGMALRIPLTAAQARRGLDRLVVLGVKPSLRPKEASERLAELLTAHVHTEGAALVPQGTPTNNTPVGPSGFARFEADPLEALRLELAEPSYAVADQPGTASDGQRLASALGLAPHALARLPHGGLTGERNAVAMMTALWPATWGYYLTQAIGTAIPLATREAARRHAREWVRARGPLPALRVGSMPYGVLPCARFRTWKPSRGDEDFAFETGLADLLGKARPSWERAAERVPRVAAGGDPEETLLRMLGMQASSSSYGLRWLFGPGYLWNLLRFTSDEADSAELVAGWRAHEAEAGAGLARLGLAEVDAPLARAAFDRRRHRWVDPLVQSGPLSETEPLSFDYVSALARSTLKQVREEDFGPDSVPRALLYVLLRHAALRTYVDTALKVRLERGLIEEAQLADPELVGLGADAPASDRFAELAVPLEGVTGRLSLGDFVSRPRASGGGEVHDAAAFQAALEHLSGLPTAELERLLTETLDTASHRWDAWTTSLATKRLARMREERPGGIQIGGYGFLENVRPAAAVAAVPSEEVPPFEGELRTDAANGGFLLAPSIDQAKAAAVLRNAFLTHAGPGDPSRFAVDLSSRRVRRALELVDGVRQGEPLGALLGYRIERGMHAAHRAPGDPELDRFVAPLRELFPPVAGRLTESGGAPASATAAQVALDGLRLLRRFRDAAVPFASHPDLPDPGSPEHAALVVVLERAADDLDAVGDTLLAEGVFQSVRGNPERASVSLDNLAGAGPLAEPEVVRGARGRLDVTHRVLVLFSNDPELPAGWASGTPRAVAEPTLDAWFGQVLGRADRVECSVRVTTPEGAVERMPVRLSQLGLAPVDFVLLSGLEGRGPGDSAGASELEERIAGQALAVRPAGSTAEILFEAAPDSGPTLRTFPEVLELARRLRQVATTARPLGPADVGVADEELPTAALFDVQGAMGLLVRAEVARDALAAALGQATNALAGFPEEAPAADPVPDLDPLRDALIELARFGIPGTVPLDANGRHAAARDALVAQARSARREAQRRLDTAAGALKGFLDLFATAGDPEEDGPGLRRFLRDALRAVFGKSFPVLPRFRAPDAAELGLALSDAGHTGLLEPGDPDAPLRWLQQTARVSEVVGSFEIAMLLAEAAGTQALDPKVAQLPFRAEDRWLGLPFTEEPDPGRVTLVIHAPEPVDAGRALRGLLLDEVVEHVPNRTETAGLSFHYDQPTARAPQALLLAVPSEERASWTWDDLAGAVEETLEMAKLRGVDLDVLGDLGHFLPAIHLAFNSEGSTVSTDVLSHLEVAPPDP